MFTDDKTKPRHLSTGKCLCQFIEEHFKSDHREQIKDLDEPLDGCCTDATKALQSELDGKQPTTKQQEKIKAKKQLNRSKSQAKTKHQQQQLQARRQRETEAIARSDTDNESTEDDEDDNDYDNKTIINMPNGLNDNPHESKRHEPPQPVSLRALNLALQANNAFNEDHRYSCESLVPTLSHLISGLEGRQDLLKVNVPDNLDPNNTNYPSKLVEGFASHLQQERIDSRSSPATDLSLELDCDSLMNRNDELIKKLKLLLEQRSNEFSKSLDGTGGGHNTLLTTKTTASHNTNQTTKHYSSSNGTTIICDNQTGHSRLDLEAHLGEQTSHRHDASSNNNNNHEGPMNHISKKFLVQADGLFFMGSKKGRQQQQGVYVKPQQRMLEIC